MMKNLVFPTVVMVTALALAAGAALFTVLGFRELFETSFKVTYMAGIIEFGKIMAISALYQFRHYLSWIWKFILLLLILVAMAVTSMGVYGFLSSSFQKDSLEITQNQAKYELLDQRKATLEQRLEGIDIQIQEVPESYVTKRMELISTFKPERDAILQELNEIEEQRTDLTLQRIEKETEFGAIILLAKSVDWLDESQAMLYFILAVIFIFDPLAVCLTYVANVGLEKAITKPEVFVYSAEPDPSFDNSDITKIINETIEEYFQEKESNTPSRSDVMDMLRNQNS
jgi:hypothetical protein